MKIICLFSLCCLAVAFTGPVDERNAFERKKIKVVAECREELKLIDKIEDNESSQGCFGACTQQKLGFLNADGTINTVAIKKNRELYNLDVGKEFEERSQRIYKKCTGEGKENLCKVAYCIHKETRS